MEGDGRAEPAVSPQGDVDQRDEDAGPTTPAGACPEVTPNVPMATTMASSKLLLRGRKAAPRTQRIRRSPPPELGPGTGIHATGFTGQRWWTVAPWPCRRLRLLTIAADYRLTRRTATIAMSSSAPPTSTRSASRASTRSSSGALRRMRAAAHSRSRPASRSSFRRSTRPSVNSSSRPPAGSVVAASGRGWRSGRPSAGPRPWSNQRAAPAAPMRRDGRCPARL